MTFKAVDRRLEGDTLLRQCQLAELYLFDVFCEICKEYNLTYFIYGGTLLGAARHKGFIPWDDDIDVAMPKKDYKRFLKIAPSVLPDTLLITPSKNHSGRDAFAKIIDRCSFVMEDRTNVEYPCGIFIDIFPYEQIARLPPKLSYNLAKTCYFSWTQAEIHRFLCHKSVLSLFNSACRALVWASISNTFRYLHYLLRFFMPTVWRCSPEVPLYQPHIGFDEKIIFPLTTIEFEGRQCLAPNNYDAYLTDYYGDWRQLPPPEKRQWHASIISPTKAPNVWWAKPYNPPPKDN